MQVHILAQSSSEGNSSPPFYYNLKTMFVVANSAKPFFIANVSCFSSSLFSKHKFHVNVQNAKHFSTVTDFILI